MSNNKSSETIVSENIYKVIKASQTHSLNKIVVKKQKQQEIMNFLKSQRINHILNDKELQIGRQWDQKGPQIFQNIVKMNYRSLSFNTKINLKCLQHIDFINLKSLYLENMNLSSIQTLQKFNFVNLEELWFHNNFITQCKSMRKMTIPKLISLSLNEANLKNEQYLNQMKCKKLQQILFDSLVQDENIMGKLYGLGINWIVKNNSDKIDTIELQVNKKIRKMLRKRFNKIKNYSQQQQQQY